MESECDRYKVFTSSKPVAPTSVDRSLYRADTRINHPKSELSIQNLDSITHSFKPIDSTPSNPPTSLGSCIQLESDPRCRISPSRPPPICSSWATDSHRRTKSASGPSSSTQRSNSVPSLVVEHQSSSVRPRIGPNLARPATDYGPALVQTRRPSPTYQPSNRRPSQLPKPLDTTNSFGVVLTDKAGKRELRSAYATQQPSTITISTLLSPDEVNFNLSSTTTIDKDGNQQTSWQITLTPKAELGDPSSSVADFGQPDRAAFQAYDLKTPTKIAPITTNTHRTAGLDVQPTSPRSMGSSLTQNFAPCQSRPTHPSHARLQSRPSQPDFVVNLVEPSPNGERWSGSDFSAGSSSVGPNREQAELALARGRRRMMSKWSDTEGESDNELESRQGD